MDKKIRLGLLALLFIVGGLLLLNQQHPQLFHPPSCTTPVGGFVSQSDENCVSCHQDVMGFTASHSQVGCTACHHGDASAKEQKQAHKGMIIIPGNLSDVDKTCSTSSCHPGIDHRVKHSLMNTMNGIIAIDRMVFGESHPHLTSIDSLQQTPADNHLRDLCASCHLGAQKTAIGPIQQESRGGGCLACHLNYTPSTQKEYNLRKINGSKKISKFHPSISLQVSNDHCFGCHSRSGRISTNYEGWHETRFEKEAVPDTGRYRILDDERVFRYVAEDIHHSKGLACIDCHGTMEVMGDGQAHAFQSEAVLSQCQDCHFEKTNRTTPFQDLQADTRRIIRLRGLDTTNRTFLHGINNQELPNVFLENNKAYLIGKLNHQSYPLSAPAPDCKAPVHQDLTCGACHTQWAPQCIACHTSYDPAAKGYDLLTQKDIKGRWNEDLGPFLADYPSLGVKIEGSTRKIITFIPGMVISLDKSGYTQLPNDVLHKRLFAPSISHTISRKGRDCKTCHRSPNALGYGRGILSSDKPWHFESAFENWEQDSLPQDAWIPFLKETKASAVTHLETRPFNLSEQKKILEVGTCLKCHKEHSIAMQKSLVNFKEADKNCKRVK